MKVLLDTTVLVAGCIVSHPSHVPAFEWLKKAKSGGIEAVVAAHSILETFSVLTRAPFKPRIGPDEARMLITRNITSNSMVTALTALEYQKLIEELAARGFMGGIVYDGLILYCGGKAKAEKIITSNTADYIRLAKALALSIEVIGL